MLSNKRVVYFISIDDGYSGHVSREVWNILEQEGLFTPAEVIFDGRQVMKYEDDRANQYYFVPTALPICLDYPKYLEEMNRYFGEFDVSGMITWHEGASAPEKILTVHTLGDVNSGIYGAANPVYMRNLLLALDRNRISMGLEDFTVVTEATHWSGNKDGDSAKLLLEFPVPMMDIEVGSEIESWENKTACKALAQSLLSIFDSDDQKVHNLLCVGGMHFDPNFAEAAFTAWDNETFGVSHIIANQWMVAGEYETEKGLKMASSCVDAIEGGIDAIAFHDKMKGCYKDLVRELGKKYQVPILKHQRLRHPADIEW